MNRDGTEHKTLKGQDGLTPARFSPDGKKVLYLFTAYPPKGQPQTPQVGVAVMDIATTASSPVADIPLNADRIKICWSPDGKKIAYSWHPKIEGDPENAMAQEVESVLMVCDPDGKNQNTITTEKGRGNGIALELLDWR